MAAEAAPTGDGHPCVTTATGGGGETCEAAGGAESLPAAPHRAAEVLGHERVDERVDARVDVGQQVDDDAQRVHLVREVI